MTRKLCLLAVAALLTFATDARAQFLGGPGYAPGGIGIQYSGGRLRISGFLPNGPVIGTVTVVPPMTVIDRRIIIQPIIISPPRPQFDLSGIDLDVESPDKLYPPGTAPCGRLVLWSPRNRGLRNFRYPRR